MGITMRISQVLTAAVLGLATSSVISIIVLAVCWKGLFRKDANLQKT